MDKEIEISIPAVIWKTNEDLKSAISKQLKVRVDDCPPFFISRKSLDSRKGKNLYRLRIQIGGESPNDVVPLEVKNVREGKAVHIVGMGPAGLFSALSLIRNGIKPVLIERGKEVRERRRDLARITKEGEVNPESNYCFGEGGAGTFSDGKLYTRSKKRGNLINVLKALVQFGAPEHILYEAHPHIGTNKLPAIITRIREYILECGGEIHFNSKLTGIDHQFGKVTSLWINKSQKWDCEHLILATGHSARDIYSLFEQNKWLVEAKAMAMGVRIEHPQSLIDQIQYRCGSDRPEYLPAAAYNMAKQVHGRGVHSFCMCPGGIICPAATSPGELVVNGWSPSRRDSRFANSGMVVQMQVGEFGLEKQFGEYAGLEFQKQLEHVAFKKGGSSLFAPAQRLMDYLSNKESNDLPDCSYMPGISSVPLREVLPNTIHKALKEGLSLIGKSMHGYLTNEAVIVGVESRTSSPLRIPRGDDFCHPQLKGLYPCGEGAGYAGGIMSAAIDGERVAESIFSKSAS